MPIVSSPQFIQKGGGVTVDEGRYVMDSMVVGFSLNVWEDLLWKLRGDLFHGDFHLVDVKDSDFGASWKKISNL